MNGNLPDDFSWYFFDKYYGDDEPSERDHESDLLEDAEFQEEEARRIGLDVEDGPVDF